jgi:hypothetical protein
MRFLPPDEQAIVCQAQELGLAGASPSPAYLHPDWCIGLSLALALPTFGYSLIVVPILWVAQHDQTIRRLAHLRDQLETIPPAEVLVFDKDISYGTHGRRPA